MSTNIEAEKTPCPTCGQIHATACHPMIPARMSTTDLLGKLAVVLLKWGGGPTSRAIALIEAHDEQVRREERERCAHVIEALAATAFINDPDFGLAILAAEALAEIRITNEAIFNDPEMMAIAEKNIAKLAAIMGDA